MRPLRRHPSSSRRGAALLLSVLVLFVVITISIQIGIGTMTDARVARNDLGLAAMDDAIESAMLEVAEQLKADAEGGEGAEDAGMDPMGAGMGTVGDGMDPTAALGGGAEGGGGAVDSKEDEWARPQRTEINGLELRIFVQDEDSKYNVLNMMHPDEDLAEENTMRVTRIIDLAREGTELDISMTDAEAMARQMREHMLRLHATETDPADFLSTIPDEERRLPLTLREFARYPIFEEHHFRDFRDERGVIVHSLGSFLTVWSALTTPSESSNSSSGAGGGLVDDLQAANSGQGLGALDGGSSSVEEDPALTELGIGTESSGGGQSEAGDEDSEVAAGEPTDGFGVNINTAPAAVLKGLFDDRDVPTRFWDDVIEYRNFEEELEPGAEEAEPVYDEYGNEVIQRQFFDSEEELQEVRGWDDLTSEEQELVNAYSTTTSNVFSVFITARRSTSNREEAFIATSASEREREEELAAGLVRTVRAVVWRREGGENGADLDSIVRWEVLDYSPYEVQDFPDEDR